MINDISSKSWKLRKKGGDNIYLASPNLIVPFFNVLFPIYFYLLLSLSKTTLEEVILPFSSILVFRSGWTLLDRVPWLSDDAALWIMLVAGTAVMVVALYLLHKRDASDKSAPAA